MGRRGVPPGSEAVGRRRLDLENSRNVLVYPVHSRFRGIVAAGDEVNGLGMGSVSRAIAPGPHLSPLPTDGVTLENQGRVRGAVPKGVGQLGPRAALAKN